eukprot:ctg_1032.g230
MALLSLLLLRFVTLWQSAHGAGVHPHAMRHVEDVTERLGIRFGTSVAAARCIANASPQRKPSCMVGAKHSVPKDSAIP